MIKQSIRGLSVLLLTLGLMIGHVSAQDSQASITRAEAVQKAQQHVNGRVLRVDQGKTTYKIKVLQKSGRVVTIDVDKRSGRVTKQRSSKK